MNADQKKLVELELAIAATHMSQAVTMLKIVSLRVEDILEHEEEFPLPQNLRVFLDKMRYQFLNDRILDLPQEIEQAKKDFQLKVGKWNGKEWVYE